MREVPGQSAPGDAEPSSRSTARRVGEYLLVTPLGDDALGSVYRALSTTDGRFVRLRLLQSPELAPSAVLAASRKHVSAAKPVERHRGLRVSDGIAYLVWPETGGWTLDVVLARARAGGWSMPVEFSLLIAERAAAEIEQAWLASPPGARDFHGALWPGFVNISADADIHVEGFGLADAILPALSKTRMWRDVAPYMAPEARQTGRGDAKTDVYSIGALLLELLTGSRASPDTPPPRWREDDEFSQEVSLLLRFALGHRSERFASMDEMRAALRDLIAACPFETSSADLALFLYEQLNPASRLPSFDGNSTNPLSQDHVPAQISHVVSPPPMAPRAKPPREIRSGEAAIFGDKSALRFVAGIRWAARATAVAAVLIAFFMTELHSRRVPDRSNGTSAVVPAAASSGAAPTLTAGLVEPAWKAAFLPLPASGRQTPRAQRAFVSSKALPRHDTGTRSSAELARLQAALARIEAQRIDADLHAAAAYREAISCENQGDKLLGRLRYAAARDAYARALLLFRRAESLAREERVRTIQVAERS